MLLVKRKPSRSGSAGAEAEVAEEAIEDGLSASSTLQLREVGFPLQGQAVAGSRKAGRQAGRWMGRL